MNIYLIRCQATGLPYVGQTRNDIVFRLKGHLRGAKRDNTKNQKFATALREFGETQFVVGLLETCEESVANERENFWINHYNSVEEGYNTMRKGISNRRGKKNSQESNSKRSATLRARREAGLLVGRPKGIPASNKKYNTEEERREARRIKANPQGRKKKRCPKTGRWITNK